MNIRLDGKRALVTGAAQGMGLAIVKSFAQAGAIVAAHARTAKAAKDTVDALANDGVRVTPVSADLRDEAEVGALCAETLTRLGGIDIIVNNAGTIGIASVEEMETDLFDRTLDTNLKAPWLLCKHLLPAMRTNTEGGRILFNASVSGKMSEASGSAYNASKAGVIAFVRCLAAEVGRFGITVNAVCPGWVDTPMAQWCWAQTPAAGLSPEDAYQAGMRANMLGALIKPEDVAAMMVFLASDQGRYITAQSINVDAGLCYW